jgi:cytochrome c-type biogenesis protein CcmH/NrfG
MLRDLDARKASAGATQLSDDRTPDVARGASSVGLGIHSPTQRGASPWLLGMLVLVLVGSAGWYWGGDELFWPPAQTPAPARAPAVTVASLAAPLPLPALPANTAPDNMGEAQVVKAPAPTPLPPALEPSLRMDAALLSVPATTARPRPTPAPRAKPQQPDAVGHETKTRSAEPASVLEPTAVLEPKAQGISISQRQAALQDAMAQAQSLWAAGSHEAALDLMRKALAVAERDQGQAGAVAAGESLLVPLARELARMELAQGRAAQALQLLTRLETALASHADLWAVRGNAAQRLGRYQESAQAYMTALRLRPDEPRWLLGAAVSLAAQGDLVQSAELAERARAAGVVSPEVLAYLRQAGVKVR